MQAQMQKPPTPQLIVVPQVVDWSAQIADVMHDQFSLKPKEPAFVYHKPYPKDYDQIALPNRYRVPDFTKFSGQDLMSTIEHATRFLIQCGEAAGIDALKICLFPLSLSRSAFLHGSPPYLQIPSLHGPI